MERDLNDLNCAGNVASLPRASLYGCRALFRSRELERYASIARQSVQATKVLAFPAASTASWLSDSSCYELA